MTSLLVIEKRPISPKPLQIGVSFLLTTNRKLLVGFQNMTCMTRYYVILVAIFGKCENVNLTVNQ